MALWDTFFFYFFALGILVSSGCVVLFRNPLYGAIALILDFFFFAALYVLLSAHFMAIIQILVYGGAIMVLFMFIIMLLNLRDDELERTVFRAHYAVGIVAVAAIFGFAATSFSTVYSADSVGTARVQATDGVIATPSAIPGLYADLNEEGLEAKYLENSRAFEDQSATPADGKYRVTAQRGPFVVPEILDTKGDDAPTFGTVEPISVLLVNRFVVPFELTALLLLAAIIGAVIIAKKRL